MHARITAIPFLALILAAFLSCGGIVNPAKPPAAGKGVLDLRSWDFKEKGEVALSGEWEFYWNRLLAPEDFTGDTRPELSGYFKVPGTWGGYPLKGKHLPGTGFATYRLRVIMGRETDDTAFSFKTVSTAMRFYVNGKLLTSMGRPGVTEMDSLPAYRSHSVAAGPLPAEFDVVMEISNFHYRTGGPWREIKIGRADALERDGRLAAASAYILFGGILIMFFYHLTMYFIRRSDVHFILFSLFCLLISFRTLTTGDYLLASLIPSIPFGLLIRIEYLSYMLAIALFGFFVLTLFRKTTSRRVIYAIGAVCGLFAITVCVTPTLIFTHIIGPFSYCAIAACSYYIFAIVCASRRKLQDSCIFLIGFIVLFLAFINDYLHNSFIIRTFNMIDVGLFMFIFTQAYTLSRRFNRAFDDVESMSRELRDLNANQEKIIEERTRDLMEKQRLMDKQLKLARSIQQSLIPDVSGSVHNVRMQAVYLPLDEVGGDFYDVIRIDEKRIGVFIADVSGHGVPAAMIASMVKSFINLHGHSGLSTTEFLLALNKLLFPMVHGYFVTSFYGIVSTDEYRMEYSLAGHPDPILIRKGGEIVFLEAKGTALGIREDPSLECRTIGYSPGDRIYLYSDGVTEVFDSGGEMFGPAGLSKLLSDHNGAEIGKTLDIVVGTLKEFQGKQVFNDDLTILAIEAL